MSNDEHKRRTPEVEGYWKSLEVDRDPQREQERWDRIEAATAAREAREAEAAARGPGRMHEQFGREMRGRGKDAVAMALLAVIGLATTLVILNGQKAALPEWVPIFGQEFFEFEAEFETGQAITPGQGQAVMVAGVQVGKIESVRLEDRHAVIGMKVEPKYQPLVRADAELLIRPKTGLNDMVIEVDPGTSTDTLEEGASIPLEQTQPNVHPEQFLATLDGDTRDYLRLLLQGASEGLEDGGEELSAAFRRLAPFSRHIARLNTAIAERRDALAGSIHSFRELTVELARHDDELANFVSSSADALGGFADQDEAIKQSLRNLPSALTATRNALDGSNQLAVEAKPTLTELIPQADALGPALSATREFFTETTGPIRDQIRPFLDQTRPVLRHTSQLSDPLAKTVDRFGDSLGFLNYGFNELAFNPRASKPGFLFYLPWLNHNLNSTFAVQDAYGPLRRALLLVSCNSTGLAEGHVDSRDYLKTVYEATNVPITAEICPPEPE